MKEPMAIRTPGFLIRDDQDGVAGDVTLPNRSGHRKGKRKGHRKGHRKGGRK